MIYRDYYVSIYNGKTYDPLPDKFSRQAAYDFVRELSYQDIKAIVTTINHKI